MKGEDNEHSFHGKKFTPDEIRLGLFLPAPVHRTVPAVGLLHLIKHHRQAKSRRDKEKLFDITLTLKRRRRSRE